MAIIHETIRTREGAARGMDGMEPAPRRVVIEVEAGDLEEDESPIVILENLFPRGSIYPWRDFGLCVVSKHRIIEKHCTTPAIYECEIIYEAVTLTLPPRAPWRWRQSTGSDSFRLLRALDNPTRDIGPLKYRLPRPPSVPAGAEAGATPTGGEAATHVAVGAAPSGGDLGLVQTLGRKQLGADVFAQSGQIEFFADLPAWSLATGLALTAMQWYVNSRPWLGLPAGTVQFAGYSCEPTTRPVPGQTDGIAYECALQFLLRPGDASKLNLVHTWQDDDGYEHVVYTLAGQPVEESFQIYPRTDLERVFTIVGT